jgi:hypothetical protein
MHLNIYKFLVLSLLVVLHVSKACAPLKINMTQVLYFNGTQIKDPRMDLYIDFDQLNEQEHCSKAKQGDNKSKAGQKKCRVLSRRFHIQWTVEVVRQKQEQKGV